MSFLKKALRKLSRSPSPSRSRSAGDDQDEVAEVTSLKFLTLNVLFVYDKERYERIVRLIERESYNLVAFQEATEHFVALLRSSLSKSYDIVFAGGRHNTAVMTSKSLSARASIQPLPHNPHRHLITVQFAANGGTVAFGTFHLQSDFFTEAATAIKRDQLLFVRNVLNATNANYLFCAGDANLTGGPSLLPIENAAIADAGFIDQWLVLHPTPESQMKKEWKREHATWCGSQNPLVKYRHEHHRPDRIFCVEPVHAIDIVRVCAEDEDEIEEGKKFQKPYSDHFGLSANIGFFERRSKEDLDENQTDNNDDVAD